MVEECGHAKRDMGGVSAAGAPIEAQHLAAVGQHGKLRGLWLMAKTIRAIDSLS